MILAWLSRITGQRARNDVRLLAVVLVVAIASCTLITSLALLITVTEEGGVRSALSPASANRARIDVTVTAPSVPVNDVEGVAATAVDSLLAGTVPSTSSTIAITGLTPIDGIGDQKPVLTYFGELDGVTDAASLIDGGWPEQPVSGADAVPVAIPEDAADALDLEVGDSFDARAQRTDGTGAPDATATEVVGVYRIDDPEDPYWSFDLLDTAGIDRRFPLPGTRAFIPTDTFGPLVTAPGTLDSATLTVQSVEVRFQPDFRALAVDDLAVISDRLSDAEVRVPVLVGRIGEEVGYSSGLSRLADDAASGLIVTRSTVLMVGLLLLVVALVALAQSARLVTASRIDERRLLRARGASLAGIRGMAAIEAAVIGVTVAVVSPPLASLVYRAIAAQPAMAAAGMPVNAGLPLLAWTIAAITAAVFVLVLLAPLVRPAELFDDEYSEQRAGRRIRPLGLVRIGIDLVIVAVAVLLYQQLVAYRAPVGEPSVRIDPILVIAPALLLGAGSLLAVRLVPIVATAFEWAGSRSRGAVVPLASWEVGRRARSATAVVLLLTLSVAVASFGSTFLATWRQSQIDQATLAFGAPVRVPADPTLAAIQSGLLVAGAGAEPQPVLRRLGQVAGPTAPSSDSSPPSGPVAQILGLTGEARSLIDRGRIGDAGGSMIARALATDITPSRTIALPVSARSVSATVRLGDSEDPYPGVVGSVSAVIEDGGGLLSTVSLGSVPIDGAEHALYGVLPGQDTAEQDAAAGLTATSQGLAGIVVDVSVDDSGVFQPRLLPVTVAMLLKDVAFASGDAATSQPLSLDGAVEWVPRAPTQYDSIPIVADPPDGWQLALQFPVPTDVDGRRPTYSLTGWSSDGQPPVVVSDSLAELMSVVPGANLTLVVSGAQIRAQLVATVPVVPGSSRRPGVADADDPSAVTSNAAVIDQVLLSRALVIAGSTGSAVDEWWVDVAPGRGQAYLDRHDDRPGGEGAESSEVFAKAQSEGPLRIATPAALWLVIAASALLTVVGFAVHTAAAMHSRRTEFAQLRAIGLTRRSLVAVIGAESVLLSVLGTAFGIAVGVLLGSAVAPLVGLTPDGSAPRPPVDVVVPVGIIAGAAGVVALVVMSVVLVVSARQRSADPATILRGAGE